MRRLVIDASVVVASLRTEEAYNEKAWGVISDFLRGELELLSIPLLPFEVTNAIWKATMRGGLSREEALDLLREFERFNLPLREISFEKALELASTHNISAYDASYLALAEAEGVPLITADKRLCNAVGGDQVMWVGDYR